MKKFFSLLAITIMTIGMTFADEAVLFDYSTKADVLNTGYDWIENSRAKGISGIYEPGRNLFNPVLSDMGFVLELTLLQNILIAAMQLNL